MESVNISIPFPVLLKAIEELPDKKKAIVAEKLNIEKLTTLKNTISKTKKYSAVELLKLPASERSKILKKQAKLAKKLYEENPELLLPDLVD